MFHAGILHNGESAYADRAMRVWKHVGGILTSREISTVVSTLFWRNPARIFISGGVFSRVLYGSAELLECDTLTLPMVPSVKNIEASNVYQSPCEHKSGKSTNTPCLTELNGRKRLEYHQNLVVSRDWARMALRHDGKRAGNGTIINVHLCYLPRNDTVFAT